MICTRYAIISRIYNFLGEMHEHSIKCSLKAFEIEWMHCIRAPFNKQCSVYFDVYQYKMEQLIKTMPEEWIAMLGMWFCDSVCHNQSICLRANVHVCIKLNQSHCIYVIICIHISSLSHPLLSIGYLHFSSFNAYDDDDDNDNSMYICCAIIPLYGVIPFYSNHFRSSTHIYFYMLVH